MINLNNAYEIAKFIKDSEKQTPVKIYITGKLLCLKRNDKFKVFGGNGSYTLIGDYSIIMNELEKVKNHIEDIHIEYDRRNSAIPMYNYLHEEARIEPGALIRDMVTIGKNAVIMMGAVVNIGAVIGEGSIVYLPIYTPGALLSVGDVHAVMGDGEIGVSGAEVGAKVDLKVDLISNFKINNPIVETYDAYYTIASAQTLDDAYKIAVEDMFEILLSKCIFNKNDLIMLMSLTCDIEVCQVVDPLKTIRYKIKKEILKKLNIDKLI